MIIILFGVISDEEKELVDKIFSKMNVKMYNISFKILRNKFDAEEALAQAFLKIIDNIEKISDLPDPQMASYCVIILKNEAINIIRQRKKNICVEDVGYSERNNQHYNIEDEFIKSANIEKLLSCINKLSDDEKNLIHLRYIYDMSYINISELLDITEETAKKRGQRIMRKLRSYYEEGENSVQNG